MVSCQTVTAILCCNSAVVTKLHLSVAWLEDAMKAIRFLNFLAKNQPKVVFMGLLIWQKYWVRKKSDHTERTHKSVKWLVQPILLHIIHSLPQLLNYSSLLKPYNPNCCRPCSKFPCSVSPCTALRDYLSHVENHNICGIGDRNISAAGEKQRKWAGGGR